MIQKLIAFIVLLFGFSNSAFCIKATVSHSLFFKNNKTDGTGYDAQLAIAWRVENNSIHYFKNEQDLYQSEIICLLRISNNSSVVKEETFVIKTPAKATASELRDQINADQYCYILKSGQYKFELVLYEEKYKSELYQYSDTFSILPIEKDKAALSEIQLLDKYFDSNENSIYNRNGFFDLPLPSNFLGEHRDSAFFYYEIYGTNKIPKEMCPIKITSYLSYKPYAAPVPHFERIDTLEDIPFQFAHIAFPIKNLSSGNYYMNVVLSNKFDEVIDKKNLFVQRYNSDTTIKISNESKDSSTYARDTTSTTHILDLTNTFVGKYTASQVREILKMMRLVCDENEGLNINGFLNKPNELYSKYFIYNFWEKRNKLEPEKPWKAFTEKIKEVNRLFRGSGIPGYETDRGRVYIQYGKPNDRIIVNNEMGALPYEIWQYYNIEKQGRDGIFLFYKSDKAIGDYTLLHSTIIGEKRNGSWRSLLYNNNITGSGSLNNDSQAEQYIGNK